MELILVCLLAAAIGGVLGLIYGKKWRNQPKKISPTVRWCLGILLGVLLSQVLDWSLGICISLGLLCSEAVGMLIPKPGKNE